MVRELHKRNFDLKKFEIIGDFNKNSLANIISGDSQYGDGEGFYWILDLDPKSFLLEAPDPHIKKTATNPREAL